MEEGIKGTLLCIFLQQQLATNYCTPELLPLLVLPSTDIISGTPMLPGKQGAGMGMVEHVPGPCTFLWPSRDASHLWDPRGNRGKGGFC